MYKTGVTEYKIKKAVVPVAFPGGEEKCRHCWLCVDDPRMRQRRICAMTYEILYDIDRVGIRCPLEEEEREADE